MKMKIGILMMYDSRYENMSKITIDKNVRQYCEMHGYRLFVHKIDGSENDRPPQWQKIIKSIEILESKEVDWLMFLDLDCLIMNSTIKIESLIDERYSLIIPAHIADAIDYPMEDNGFGGNSIISAMYIAKSDEMGLAILKDVWEKNGMPKEAKDNEFDYEQRQFRITLSKPEFRKHVNIVEESRMHTSWYINDPFSVFFFTGCNENAWKPGKFIVHVTTYALEDRTRLLDWLNHFSGGDVTKMQIKEGCLFFSPIKNIKYANIKIKDMSGNILRSSNFENLMYRIKYFISLPENTDRAIVEAYDEEGRIITQRIVERAI